MPTPAEPAGPLTLPAALLLAEGGNATLSAARHELAAQGGALQQARSLPNPELQAVLEDTRRAARSTTVQLNQLIELGGKRGAHGRRPARRRPGASRPCCSCSKPTRAPP